MHTKGPYACGKIAFWYQADKAIEGEPILASRAYLESDGKRGYEDQAPISCANCGFPPTDDNGTLPLSSFHHAQVAEIADA
jgi:hypothetical protein